MGDAGPSRALPTLLPEAALGVQGLWAKAGGAGERISRSGALTTTSPWGVPKKRLQAGQGGA